MCFSNQTTFSSCREESNINFEQLNLVGNESFETFKKQIELNFETFLCK